MSSDDRNLTNVHALIDHLAQMRFTGTVLVAFHDGAPNNVSRKEDLDPAGLDRFLHRPVVVRRVKAESKIEPGKATDETVPKTPEVL